MHFSKYQKEARKTAIYQNQGRNLSYPTLGLCGEAGEVAEKVKKLFRDKNGKVDAEFIELIKKEIGDVLWYLAALCTELKLDMDEVAESNLKKLFKRKAENKIKGSGDLR